MHVSTFLLIGSDGVQVGSPNKLPPPKIILFIHNVKLNIILNKALRILYGSKDDARKPSNIPKAAMLEFEQRVALWAEELPAVLKYKTPAEAQTSEYCKCQRPPLSVSSGPRRFAC